MKTPAILLYYLILFSRVFSVNFGGTSAKYQTDISTLAEGDRRRGNKNGIYFV